MPKKILVVDDERHIVRLIRTNLELAGYEVVAAFDGKEALEQVNAEKPDLVILDVVMPGIDGLKVLQNLRENTATSELPIIMMQQMRADADLPPWAWKSNVNGYLLKPFNPEQMHSIVKRLLAAQDGTEQ